MGVMQRFLGPIKVNRLLRDMAADLIATGTTVADALLLKHEFNEFGTVAASTGAKLPLGVIGMKVTIFNAGANVLTVYGSGTDTIDTVAAGTGVPLTNAKRANFYFTSAGEWISAQLGAISA